MMYLCHYYLSIYIVMNGYIDNEVCDPITTDNFIYKDKIRLPIARGMLGESYWKLGKVLKNNQFINAARIHFELCIGMGRD